MIIRSSVKFLLISLSLLIPELLLAAKVSSNPGESNIRLVMTQDAGAELQLEVRQASMRLVLDGIASKIGLRINYSVLPDGLVTATCVGSTVKQVLECLLVGKADLIFRYSETPTKTKQQAQPLEAWVLGAKFGLDQANSIACSSTETQAGNTKNDLEPDETDALLKRTIAITPEERAEAIGRLMAGGRKGDIAVRKALENALTDPDARVRVRAISSLAHREGAGAVDALHEALHDSDASVRITAVDNAGNDVAMLQQALTDNDATVRQLAGIRLEPLLKTGLAQ